MSSIFNTIPYCAFKQEAEKQFNPETELKSGTYTVKLSSKRSNDTWKMPPAELNIPFAKTIDQGSNAQESLNKWLKRAENYCEQHEGTTEKKLCKREIVVYFTQQGTLEKKMFQDSGRQCATCQQWESTVHRLLLCSACQVVTYCNGTCQKKDWPQHKKACVKH